MRLGRRSGSSNQPQPRDQGAVDRRGLHRVDTFAVLETPVEQSDDGRSERLEVQVLTALPVRSIRLGFLPGASPRPRRRTSAGLDSSTPDPHALEGRRCARCDGRARGVRLVERTRSRPLRSALQWTNDTRRADLRRTPPAIYEHMKIREAPLRRSLRAPRPGFRWAQRSRPARTAGARHFFRGRRGQRRSSEAKATRSNRPCQGHFLKTRLLLAYPVFSRPTKDPRELGPHRSGRAQRRLPIRLGKYGSAAAPCGKSHALISASAGLPIRSTAQPIDVEATLQ